MPGDSGAPFANGGTPLGILTGTCNSRGNFAYASITLNYLHTTLLTYQP